MIPGELLDLEQHLFLHCCTNNWYAIKTTNHYDYNLQLAINLNYYQYQTILVASGIFTKRGNLLCISKQHIEELQTALQENIILHYFKAKVQSNGTQNYYICIGEPTHQDPIIQARIPAPIADRWVNHHHHLAWHHQILIECLCNNDKRKKMMCQSQWCWKRYLCL